jgi:hypothetical protein
MKADKKISVIMFFILFLYSCDVMNTKEAIEYANQFVSNKKVEVNEIEELLHRLNAKDKVIALFTKPGSHILDLDCKICVEKWPNEEKRKVADFMDANKLTYMQFRKEAFVDYGLRIRNSEFNNYFIRHFKNPTDSDKILDKNIKQVYLKENWFLCVREGE